MKRNRILYAVLAAACIGLGLASRAFRADLPAFLGEYGGDTIWAMMVYFLFAVLLARKPVWLVSLCALVFSYGIEFSQIYHAPWIDSVRATTLGGAGAGPGLLSQRPDLLRGGHPYRFADRHTHRRHPPAQYPAQTAKPLYQMKNAFLQLQGGIFVRYSPFSARRPAKGASFRRSPGFRSRQNSVISSQYRFGMWFTRHLGLYRPSMAMAS